MNGNYKFTDIFTFWVKFIEKKRLYLIIAFTALAIASLFSIKNNLSFSTSTSDMLSEELSWRQLDIEYEKIFPQFIDNVLIVIEAESPDLASDTAYNIYESLKTNQKFLKDIYYPKILPYLKKSSFLFLEYNELQDLSDRLASIQPFLGTLLEDRSLRGLFKMIGNAIDAKKDNENIDINPILREINRAFNEKNYSVSWQRLMDPHYENKKVFREFIELQINDEEDELLPNKNTIEKIRSIVNSYNSSSVNIRLTGGEVLAYEELKSVSNANVKAIILSIILVGIILYFGLGSLRLVFACLTTLLLGLIITTAFASITIGELNLISIAFAVLYIGLGIDFAIHMALRFKEESNISSKFFDAFKRTIKYISKPLVLCAVTTSIGFYAFIPTNYRGVAELGWIAGSGMIISLILTFTLLPALLTYIPKHKFENKINLSENNFFKALSALPYKYTKSILIASLILVIFLSLQINKISFDNNRLNLQDPKNESVQTYKELLKSSKTSPWEAILITESNSANNAKQEIEKLSLVDKVISIDDFFPKDQDDKLMIIDEMNLMLGQLTINSHIPNITNSERLDVIQKFEEKLSENSVDTLDKELRLLKNNLLLLLEKDTKNLNLEEIENQLLGNLLGRIMALSDALNAEKISLNEIPREIYQRWVNNNKYRLKILPKDDLNNNDSMKKFVVQLQKYNKSVVGSPIINVEAGNAVVNAFQTALIYAFIVITLLLILLMRAKYNFIIILASVSVGCVFTFGFMILFNIPLNFANIIGLPLLLGIGVDSGIHITERFYEEKESGTSIYMTSSMRGVVISTLTTVFSIGNLAFSSHQGTASMGLLLSLGLISMMIATMIILPSFLIWCNSLGK